MRQPSLQSGGFGRASKPKVNFGPSSVALASVKQPRTIRIKSGKASFIFGKSLL